MDLSSRVEQIRQGAQQIRALWHQQRFVVCFGQRSSLCFAITGHLSGAEVVGACTTAGEALACIARHRPDCLLCSDQLEQSCGLDLVVQAKRQQPELRTLVLIHGKPQASRLRSAIDAGCDGLLLDRSLGAGTASKAVATICGGGVVIDREIVALLRPQTAGLLQPLSAREHEVLTLLSQGANNAEIAQRLVISIDTVKSHLKNVLLKLGARGRTHAAVLALQLGLVDWPADQQGR